MTRLHRRPRAVYRVYGEEEYLAGADAFLAAGGPPPGDFGDGSTPGNAKHGRRLQRIAGAAALTGAVGTVGGVVGLAGLRAHAVDRREIAKRIVPSVRIRALRGHTDTPAHATRRQIRHPGPPRRMPARRTAPAPVSPGAASRAGTPARAIAVTARRSTPAHRSEIDEISERPPSARQSTPTAVASAAQGPPSATPEARPGARSEFGFER